MPEFHEDGSKEFSTLGAFHLHHTEAEERILREMNAIGLLGPSHVEATQISREEWDILSNAGEVVPIMCTQEMIFGMKNDGDYVAVPF